MEYRRFGKTEMRMPVITSSGMRFQHSWKSKDEVPTDSQENVKACIHRAMDLGINHFETARGYGTSEAQMGKVLPDLPRQEILVQTKVGPMADVDKFVATFEKSMRTLNMDYLDLLSIHGINNEEGLENAMKCLEPARKWKEEGRIRDIGFSTHALTSIIVKAIETDAFDHVNLHWYYIFQENWPAIEAASARDMGVFIISPNDKGGMLYKPSDKLRALTAPLHPMVFNGLFCLSRPEVHTLSCGISRPEDFDIHMETVEKVDQAEELVKPIVKRLEEELVKTFGAEWAESWDSGLPDFNATPGNINLRWILRLNNLAVAYDMIEYGKMRYNMLGNGGTWFPGQKAEKVRELDLGPCLKDSPHAKRIIEVLTEAHALLGGQEQKRLQEA